MGKLLLILSIVQWVTQTIMEQVLGTPLPQ